MRILWFTNTPCGGQDYIDKSFGNSSSGGWLKSLDKSIQDRVDLHIVFYHSKVSKKFKYGKTQYYPIKRENFYLSIIKNIYRKKILDIQDESIYLELINDIKPDLIHIHGTENPFGCIIDKTNIPILVSIQGIITACYNKFCTGIEYKYLRTLNGSLSIRTLIDGLFPFLRNYDAYWKMAKIEQRNLQKCRHIMGRTDWDRRITSVLASKSSYHFGGEILRDSFYLNQWKNHNSNKLIINTTSSNNPYKGFETICKSTSLLNGLGIDFEWRVAGISENDLVVKITKRKLKADFPTKNLVLLGRLSESDLVTSLIHANIYVMCSHIENSPNNLCEAMILGVPCIATYVGGTGSMLKDKEEGILVQDGDPWAIAGAILEMRQNPILAIKMGVKARETALQRHNPEKIIEDILDAYKSIIENENSIIKRT